MEYSTTSQATPEKPCSCEFDGNLKKHLYFSDDNCTEVEKQVEKIIIMDTAQVIYKNRLYNKMYIFTAINPNL